MIEIVVVVVVVVVVVAVVVVVVVVEVVVVVVVVEAGLEYFQGKFPRPSASRLITVNFLVVFTKHRFLRRVMLNRPIVRHASSRLVTLNF